MDGIEPEDNNAESIKTLSLQANVELVEKFIPPSSFFTNPLSNCLDCAY